jgi:hypothetical protein
VIIDILSGTNRTAFVLDDFSLYNSHAYNTLSVAFFGRSGASSTLKYLDRNVIVKTQVAGLEGNISRRFVDFLRHSGRGGTPLAAKVDQEPQHTATEEYIHGFFGHHEQTIDATS